MEFNFSFTNPVVEEFFSSNGPPSTTLVSMFVYLHEHPLIKDSFLREIEKELEVTAEHVKRINLKTGSVLQPLIDATIALSKNLPDSNPAEGLIHLRTVRNESLSLQKLASPNNKRT